MSGNVFSQYTISFEKDETIYSQNDPGNCMFVIKEGQVGLFKAASNSLEKVAELSKGDFFGELSILEASSRLETARALTACNMVVIHRNTFVKMLKANMEIAIRLLQKLSSKLRQSEEHINQLMTRIGKMQNSTHTTQPSITSQPEKQASGKLVSLSSNRVFVLDADRNLVGRYDPVTSIKPEVDLTYEDDNRSVSRRHAIIFRRTNKFFVQEEIGVLNGTYVNGVKASAGGEQPIKDQDVINFGMLAFKFHLVEEGSG